MRRLLLPALIALGLAVPAQTASAKPRPAAAKAKANPNAAAMDAAASNPNRAEDAERDKYRHPQANLAFYRIAPDMKVGEYAPGGGWYSRLLGNYLGDKGRLVGLFFNPDSGPFDEKGKAGIIAGAAKFPADVAGWTGKPAERFGGFTLGAIPSGEEGTYDRIIVARMMHNMLRWNMADAEIKAMRKLLKPDGLLGIEQHRAKAGAPFAYTDGTKGYLREADVIRFMEVNGFTLVGKSEINANPKDPANHPEGVWELPPNLRTKREELKAIGESDRMTLLFRVRP